MLGARSPAARALSGHTEAVALPVSDMRRGKLTSLQRRDQQGHWRRATVPADRRRLLPQLARDGAEAVCRNDPQRVGTYRGLPWRGKAMVEQVP